MKQERQSIYSRLSFPKPSIKSRLVFPKPQAPSIHSRITFSPLHQAGTGVGEEGADANKEAEKEVRGQWPTLLGSITSQFF
jgi:hypothetical protein